MGGRQYHATRPTLSLRPVSTTGIAVLAVAKGADLVTTVLGLTMVDGLTERNPVAAWMFHHYGVGGLLAVTLLAVGAVVVVVEWGVSTLSRVDGYEHRAHYLYYASYLPLTVLYGFASIHNAALVVPRLV
jgi:hypothetical protein